MSDERTDATLEIAGAAATGLALLVPPASLLAVVLRKVEGSRQRRQRDLLRSMAESLEAVRSRLDDDFVKTEEFEELVEEIVEKGQRRKELEKREFYAAIVANAASSELIDSYRYLLARIQVLIDGAIRDDASAEAAGQALSQVVIDMMQVAVATGWSDPGQPARVNAIVSQLAGET